MKNKCYDNVLSVGAFAGAAGVIYLSALRSFVSFLSGSGFSVDYDGVMFFAMQAMVIVSLVGSLSAYRKHRNVLPPILAIASAAAVIYGINSHLDMTYMFPGMLGMLAVSVWNSFETRRAAEGAE